MRVLIVEDFEVLARSIGTGLRREGRAVDVVLDGDDALARLAATRYDVVVLDRDLPGTHGDDVCRDIVASGAESRVLMLTAAGTVRDRVEGLGLGAASPSSPVRPCPSHCPSSTSDASTRRTRTPVTAAGFWRSPEPPLHELQRRGLVRRATDLHDQRPPDRADAGGGVVAGRYLGTVLGWFTDAVADCPTRTSALVPDTAGQAEGRLAYGP